ncbi:2-phospho-L-lactate guanylyltransferase [Parasphingorhabdus sp.]|uniref:2-phospho-L-lactate guanylyltransferase n=1 Tax=Parasphingorhabdus sp. TaxID=2709688 RepID=UPI003BB192E8
MTGWQVLVPIKQGNEGKSRLGPIMKGKCRSDLAERMASHVLSTLQECFNLNDISILSPVPPQAWQGRWVRDEGRGLNPEVTAWHIKQDGAPICIVHADLPLLSVDDVQALLGMAQNGAALATDRTGQGTNALAIADLRPFQFCFGANSRALHCQQYPDMPVLERIGLAADLDTPDDAEFVRVHGFAI